MERRIKIRLPIHLREAQTKSKSLEAHLRLTGKHSRCLSRSLMDPSELRFFNPNAETSKTRNNLPHWQQDYFDRLVRDADHFANCVRYIRRNPVKAKLRAGEYTLWESEMVQGISSQ
jgi:hypothetical protein